MKELKIMKALRYILIVVSMLSVLSVRAQGLAQDWGRLPEVQMHSTSAMVGSGSTLPFAATSGAVVAGNVPGTYSPAYAPTGPRRISGGNSGGGDGPTTPVDVWSTPMGDALLPLAVMACAYLILRVTRKRKSAMSK